MATEDVQFSTDPQLEAKIRDVIGLCLHPPDNAIVLCVDEKLSSSTSSKSCRAYPQDELRVVLDNYQTHKHADITTWLQDHPRVSLPFTPTSEAWLNLVDIITRQAIRRGSSNNVTELITAIKTFHHRLGPALPPVRLDQDRRPGSAPCHPATKLRRATRRPPAQTRSAFRVASVGTRR